MVAKPFSSERQRERFLAKIEPDTNGGCWLWSGSICSTGYGEVRLAGKTIRAHRRSWEIHNGPIPVGLGYHGTCVCHRCDIRVCVNPDHLFLGSHKDNVADCDAKGLRQRLRGSGHPMAKLSDEQVRRIHELASGGLSQRALAAMFGVSQPHIGRLLRRESHLLDFIKGRAKALKIGKAAKVPVQALMAGE